MTMRKRWSPRGLGSAVAALWIASCAAAQPTEQLVEAREVMRRAEAGMAATHAPARLADARKQLQIAEAAYSRRETTLEAHHAYLADRLAQQAIAWGDMQRAEQTKKSATDRYYQTQKIQEQRQQRAWRETQDRLHAVNAELIEIDRQLTDTSADRPHLEQRRSELQGKKAELERKLALEHAVRIDNETRAVAALTRLEQIAKVEQQPHETVITISGTELFADGRAALLPAARAKLKLIADAIHAQGGEKRLAVNGYYSDVQGKDEEHLQLSRERAQAVRNFLIENGLDGDRIDAVGKGQSVASAATAKQPADDQRVEIVVREAAGVALEGEDRQ